MRPRLFSRNFPSFQRNEKRERGGREQKTHTIKGKRGRRRMPGSSREKRCTPLSFSLHTQHNSHSFDGGGGGGGAGRTFVNTFLSSLQPHFPPRCFLFHLSFLAISFGHLFLILNELSFHLRISFFSFIFLAVDTRFGKEVSSPLEVARECAPQAFSSAGNPPLPLPPPLLGQKKSFYEGPRRRQQARVRRLGRGRKGVGWGEEE